MQTSVKHWRRSSLHHWVWVVVFFMSSMLAMEPEASAAVDVDGRKCVHAAIKNNNFREAFEQACKMADHDCKYSQCLLGIMYEQGIGVKKDVSKAISWYQKAAEKGMADAQYRLGRLYYFGKEVKRNPSKAAKLFNQAAEQGVAKAQYFLGLMYLKGDGLPKDLRKARRWLRISADKGIVEAKKLLASSHFAKETIQQGKRVVRKVQDHANAGGRIYGQTLENTEMSWKGYADIVNALDKASAGAEKVSR